LNPAVGALGHRTRHQIGGAAFPVGGTFHAHEKVLNMSRKMGIVLSLIVFRACLSVSADEWPSPRVRDPLYVNQAVLEYTGLTM